MILKDINNPLHIGLDVGSTTVKAVVIDADNTILWKAYQRHHSRQPESVLVFLKDIEQRFPHRAFKVFTTGNGGRSLVAGLGGMHVQEVNAVTTAVEKLYPRAGAAVELGGQDAKIILWKTDDNGRRTSRSFMNDKCAGGTGATLDKIFTKIGLSPEALSDIRAVGKSLHNIAAKCGVFAETDVVGLMKAGVHEDEIVVSLCNAVVKQNIEVLLHGNLLLPDILLLGGPHTYLRVFEDLWRQQIPEIWALHQWPAPKRSIEKMIFVPDDAQYFAALGAVMFGVESIRSMPSEKAAALSHYEGTALLEEYIHAGKETQLRAIGNVKPGLVSSDEERQAFANEYAAPIFMPPDRQSGRLIRAYLGVDGGSTSSKIALIDTSKDLIYKDYVLSKGNPIIDVREMLSRLDRWVTDKQLNLEILGVGVTGYAASILQQAFGIDVAVVETVAHLKSARHAYGDVDIICDVGGQDIKVLFMKHNRVVDIKLNTQCSAGNGYFLQNMAAQFGIALEDFADAAFSARKAPSFNYGCAVFMEQDKVNFQQLGWSKEEIMAGLALVLPLNIWNYVVQESDLRRFGTRFLLQGGTQKNLAAVKAQVDFIKSRVPGAKVTVHAHADIAGAVGAALEAIDRRTAQSSTFIGVKAAKNVSFAARNNEDTVCGFCANRCKRTFIDIQVSAVKKVRYISGYGCEKGQSDNLDDMKRHRQARAETSAKYPNLVAEAARSVFSPQPFEVLPATLSNREDMMKRRGMAVGIPKLLNLYMYAPFFYAYFKSLGIGEVIYSDFTNEKMWSEGNKWGAIDPCFPAKVAPAHIFNLLKQKDITHICFPMITHLETTLENTLGNNACVIQMGTSEVVHAAFTKRRDLFLEEDKPFWKPLVRLDRPLEAAGNLFEYFKDRLSLTAAENDWAVRQGYAAVQSYLAELRDQGARVIDQLVEADRIGILVIGHPYHHDPGLNHGIPEAFQQRGFPVLCIESLPVSRDFLDPLFSGEGDADRSPLDVSDVWQNCFNRNTNAKIWAAKVAARHPNLAVIDLSSFKCGHDAPTYSYIAEILDASETPHFLFHDLDQNKPNSTFNIRIDSIDYFLRKEEIRLREKLSAMPAARPVG